LYERAIVRLVNGEGAGGFEAGEEAVAVPDDEGSVGVDGEWGDDAAPRFVCRAMQAAEMALWMLEGAAFVDRLEAKGLGINGCSSGSQSRGLLDGHDYGDAGGVSR